MSVVFESVIYLCFFCDLSGWGWVPICVFFVIYLCVACPCFQGVPAGSRHVVRGGAACS